MFSRDVKQLLFLDAKGPSRDDTQPFVVWSVTNMDLSHE